MPKKSTTAPRAPVSPNEDATTLPRFADALQAYEHTLCDALEGGKTDAETNRRIDANNRALETFTGSPARTPRELGEKLRILLTLLTDRNGHGGGFGDGKFGEGALLDHEMPDDRRAAALLESLCKDVAAIDARGDDANDRRAVNGTRIENLEAFDRMASRVTFVAASSETLRQGIEFGDVAKGAYLHDAVATIAHLAEEAKDALDEAFACPSVTP
ncbi:MAG: hypothetical protein KBA31_00210 [Alphaproteobacteria bacterium]|nr:hypothetical protein [Alphaproteobacteria bacterium]